jgi:hypothetical protein
MFIAPTVITYGLFPGTVTVPYPFRPKFPAAATTTIPAFHQRGRREALPVDDAGLKIVAFQVAVRIDSAVDHGHADPGSVESVYPFDGGDRAVQRDEGDIGQIGEFGDSIGRNRNCGGLNQGKITGVDAPQVLDGLLVR